MTSIASKIAAFTLTTVTSLALVAGALVPAHVAGPQAPVAQTDRLVA